MTTLQWSADYPPFCPRCGYEDPEVVEGTSHDIPGGTEWKEYCPRCEAEWWMQNTGDLLDGTTEGETP